MAELQMVSLSLWIAFKSWRILFYFYFFKNFIAFLR